MGLIDILLEKNRNRFKRPEAYVSLEKKLYQFYEKSKWKVKSDPLKDYFLHFTDMDKLGFNPKADYISTPLGYYGYPLNVYVDLHLNTHDRKRMPSFFAKTTNELENGEVSLKNIPFGNNRKYLFIFSLKETNNVIDMHEKLPFEEFKIYFDKAYDLQKKYKFELVDYNPETISNSHDFAKWFESFVTNVLEKSMISYKFSNRNKSITMGDSTDFYGYQLYKCFTILNGKNINAMTKFFLDLGIDGFYDDGTMGGHIHTNEPFQIVVFNPKIINVEEKLVNKNGDDSKKHTNLSHLENTEGKISTEEKRQLFEPFYKELKNMVIEKRKLHNIPKDVFWGKKLYYDVKTFNFYKELKKVEGGDNSTDVTLSNYMYFYKEDTKDCIFPLMTKLRLTHADGCLHNVFLNGIVLAVEIYNPYFFDDCRIMLLNNTFYPCTTGEAYGYKSNVHILIELKIESNYDSDYQKKKEDFIEDIKNSVKFKEFISTMESENLTYEIIFK